jgi:predicted acylesterase/phospholipase RssA
MAAERRREVRLALVLNGGVSLAIWIGGVTREIDEMRLGSELDPDPPPPAGKLGSTGRFYCDLMETLQQRARVDVIAGASAGGINGILLGSAIYAGKPLPAGLREIWIGLGDVKSLLRSPSKRDPPSLMLGDDVVLTQLRETVSSILSGPSEPQDQSVFVYVTATDLLGRWLPFVDTTGRSFRERDHRRVLHFEHRHDDTEVAKPATPPKELSMPQKVRFKDGDAPELLARSGRATASFPIAFEPHELAFAGEKPTDKPDHRWLIDGGLLDNQPFNPVLDRISVLPAAVPVRRVVAYVVPYVDEPASALDEAAKTEKEEANARQVYGATGALPRTLPKLASLERVREELRAQLVAESDRRRLWGPGGSHQNELRSGAEALFEAYRRTRYAASRRAFESWSEESFVPGDGVLAQSPELDPLELLRVRRPSQQPVESVPDDMEWVPPKLAWRSDACWRWGFSPAERVAAWAVLFLRDALEGVGEPVRGQIIAARKTASSLVWETRKHKQSLQQTFAALREEQPDAEPLALARKTYAREKARLVALHRDFVELDNQLAALGPALAPCVIDLLHLEVVRNALSIDDPRVPFPFEFLFMSAGIGNALNHTADSPEEKLAGMQAGHFGGFLKRSWRANDWLWGRLDGVQHMIRATVDIEWLAQLPNVSVDRLAKLAFPDDNELRPALDKLAGERVRRAGLDPGGGGRESFGRLLREAIELHKGRGKPDPTIGRQEEMLRRFRCCQGALAARAQLIVLEEELGRVAETAAEDVEAGASRISEGARWASRFYGRGRSLRATATLPMDTEERVRRFRELRIGEKEKVEQEASSRAAIDMTAQTIAVATAMFAGHRGGLPPFVRAALATVRGITLAASGLVRLVAASPGVGAAFLAGVAALLVWGLLAPNTVLGALVPTLAALMIVGCYILLNFATGALEPTVDNWKRLAGMVLLIGIPAAFAVLMISHDNAREAVQDGIGDKVTGVVVALAALTAVAALVRILVGLADLAAALLRSWRPRWLPNLDVPLKWRRSALAAYRLFFVSTLLLAAAGFGWQLWRNDGLKCEGQVCTGWNEVADEHQGLLLFGLLVAAALIAAMLVELAIPRWVEHRNRSRAKKFGFPGAQ